MRKSVIMIVLGIEIFFFMEQVSGQSSNQEKGFQSFSSKFPLRNFPFVLSYDFDKITPFDVPEAIPNEESNAYVVGQGIPFKPENCDEDKFLNFVYFGKFNISKSFFVTTQPPPTRLEVISHSNEC